MFLVDLGSCPDEQGMNEAVSPAGILPGQIMNQLAKFAVLAWFGLIVTGRFG